MTSDSNWKWQFCVRRERATIKPPPPAALITATAHGPSHISHNTPVVMRRWPASRLTGRLSNNSACTVWRHSRLICWRSTVDVKSCNLTGNWWRLSAYWSHIWWPIWMNPNPIFPVIEKERGWRRYRCPGLKERKGGPTWWVDEWL